MFKLFDAYRRENTNPNHDTYCDVDFLLRLWRENKGQYLAPLFGDKLILEKEMEYERDREQLRDDMYAMIRSQYDFIDTFNRQLKKQALNEHDRDFSDVMENLIGCLHSSDRLIENCLSLGCIGFKNDRGWYDYKDRKSYTFVFENDRKIQLQAGMKVTRVMSQLCNQIGLNEEWEKFRIAHSQVLNQKKLKGTLCLSIHPLDYATASDNDNGWSSCMSWREEGCYRMGTVEMMNSPMVICAYLKSNNQHMTIVDNDDWNSKKWRAWIIVTKDVIICNRHYPYHQEVFAVKAIEWVKELVGAHYGWQYEDIHTDFMAYERDTDREVEFRTNYMYNDIGGDDVIGCFRLGAKMRNLPGYINFSGPAECMVCGEQIEPRVQEADTLLCNDCHRYAVCEECGNELDEDQAILGPDGYYYCEECYGDLFCNCDHCGNVVSREDTKDVVMPMYKESLNTWLEETCNGCQPTYGENDPHYYAWRDMHWLRDEPTGCITMCEDCANTSHIITINFNDEEINVPDPHYYDMESAYKLIRPSEWTWAKRVHNQRYLDDEDKIRTEDIIRMYTINWEVFLKKNFPDLVQKQEELDA